MKKHYKTNRWYVTVALFFCVFTAFSQKNRVVNGFVHCEGEPVENVCIEFSKDTLFEVFISDANGKFTSIPLPEGDYQITTRHISYKPINKVYTLQEHLEFSLETNYLSLGEVTVKADIRKAIRVRDGNRVLDPSYLGDIRANTTLQIMTGIPGLMVSPSGITVNGQPARLQLNNRNISLPGNAMQAYLQSIPADMLKEIVVAASSAANAASETGGVVNIVLKKEKDDAHSLSIGGQLKSVDDKFAGGSSGLYTRQQGNSYFSMFLNYENGYTKNTKDLHTIYSDGGLLDAYQLNTERGNAYFGTANYDYTFRNKSILHFNGSFYYADTNPFSDYDQSYTNPDGTKERVTDYMKSDDKGDLYQVYMDYRTNDSLALRHNVSYGIIWGKSNVLSENHSSVVSIEELLPYGYISETAIRNRHYGAQHQFNYNLTYKKEKFEFAAGLRLDLGNLTPSSLYDSIVAGEPVRSDLFSSQYKISENLYASYASATYKMNRLLFAIGLRGEITDMDVLSQYDRVDWNYEKAHLFPFARINGDFGGVNSTIAFSSGIDRASYWYYVPNYRYKSKYSYSTGNPNLLPTRFYKVGFDALLFDFIDINLAYIYNKDKYGSFTYPGDEGFEEVTTYLNYADENRFTMNLYVPYQFLGDKLSGFLGFYGEYAKLINTGEMLNLKNKVEKFFLISNSLQYRITKNLSAGYFFRYQGACDYRQTEQKPFSYLDLNASYTYKNFTIGVQAYDVFNTLIYKGASYYVNNETHFNTYFARSFEVSIRFNFMRGKKINERANRGADASRFQ